MKLIIDDADIKAIRHICEYYPVSGVTTNPSILAKAGKDPFETLMEIRSLIGCDLELHAQATAKDAEGMIKDAHKIIEKLGDTTYVKIPAIEEGFKAMKKLHQEGIRITATVIYTPMQAYISGLCGADYVAPYVNRIDNLGYDGIQVACDIHDIFEKNNISCKVLGASFKNAKQVLALCKHGIAAATVSSDLFKLLVQNEAVDSAVLKFANDFAALVGDSFKSMKDF